MPKIGAESSILAFVCNLSRCLLSAITIFNQLFALTVEKVRADESLCVHLLIVEHLISRAEVSSFEVILSRSVTQEQVIGYSVFQIAFIKSYDRWVSKRLINHLLTIFSYSFCSFSA